MDLNQLCPERARKNAYREMLRPVLDLGLEDKLDAKVGSLSGGQRQAHGASDGDDDAALIS